mmetsp:Transcript_44934/g.106805  ORF Transcript_44934/g.106805 Transcript_44934/m.106805 type:complete len:216 (-) Transcript_44934:5525-6172(-)
MLLELWGSRRFWRREGIRGQLLVAHVDLRHHGRALCRRFPPSDIDTQREWSRLSLRDAEGQLHCEAAAHREAHQHIGASPQVGQNLVDQCLQHGSIARVIRGHHLLGPRATAREFNRHDLHRGFIFGPGGENQGGAAGEGQAVGPKRWLRGSLFTIPDQDAACGGGCRSLGGDVGRGFWILCGIHIHRTLRVHPKHRRLKGVGRQSGQHRRPRCT